MEQRELPKSQKALHVEITLIAIATTLTAILSGLIIGAFFKFMIGSFNGSRILTFLIVLGIGGIAAMIYYAKWQAQTYILRHEGIVVSNGLGNFSRKQKLFLYESIISVSFNQNYFGKKYGYGNLHITIPKLDQKLILKDVVEPDEQLPLLQQHIQNKAGTNNVLVT